MNAYIITGTSRGLGEAIVNSIMESVDKPLIYCLSRSVNEGLLDRAAENEIDLDYITYDLNDLQGIAEIMEDIMEEIIDEKDILEGVYLINNAGVLAPVMAIDHAGTEALIANIGVNLLAPMILTGEFIKWTKGLEVEKRIINISSGAANHGYYGWSAYCSAKAGLNRFSETVAMEQAYQKFGTKIISFAPGILDTDMQGEIRATKAEDFKDLDRFIAFKENGDLVAPSIVARDLVALLHHKNFPSGKALDIRTMDDTLLLEE